MKSFTLSTFLLFSFYGLARGHVAAWHKGDFLELPAGGTFTVEHAVNQAYTSLSFGGRNTGDWVNGEAVPNLGDSNRAADGEMPCIGNPNLHTQNESMAAGTAFAISYESDITRVTPENLVIFTVAYNTPWRRIATYSVPAAMPACPPEGCICGWGWVSLKVCLEARN
ncbi:hypothetical protein EYR38_009547 [Pleurotus pulmonarius]|nr:hypothetical protein EYR38_009547 [Pleurotus pulmonarius]